MRVCAGRGPARKRPYKAEVGGSKPPAPTEKAAGQSQLSVPVHHRDAGGIPHRFRGKTAGATFLPVRPHGSRIESADSRPGRYADWVAAMFVGRDGELAALEEFTARALRERVPVAAVLFGDPGMAWASGAREHRSRRDSASRSNLRNASDAGSRPGADSRTPRTPTCQKSQ